MCHTVVVKKLTATTESQLPSAPIAACRGAPTATRMNSQRSAIAGRRTDSGSLTGGAGPGSLPIVSGVPGPAESTQHSARPSALAMTKMADGDHVDDVFGSLDGGVEPLASMAGVTAEPDPPLYTPRIWVAVQPREPTSPALLGHARRRPDGGTTRCLWAVSDLASGTGVLLTTYSGTAAEVSVTDGPRHVSVGASDPHDVLTALWEMLDPNLRVAAVLLRPDSDDSMPMVLSAESSH